MHESWQLHRGGQWVKGKSCDTFNLLGPWLATSDEINDVNNLAMTLDVNGQRRQTGNTSTMIFPVDDIVRYLSHFIKVCQVNLVGSFIVTKHAIIHMKQTGYGRILLIASIAGKEGNAGMACYSASKAGVIGLVKSVGKEFAETDITINGLAPATIRTAMVAAMPEQQIKYGTSAKRDFNYLI